MTKEVRVFRIISSVMFALLMIVSGVVLFRAYSVGNVDPLSFIAKIAACAMWLSLTILFLSLGFKEIFKEEYDVWRAVISLFFGVVFMIALSVVMLMEALYVAEYQAFCFGIAWIVLSAAYGKYLAIKPARKLIYLVKNSAEN